MGADTGTGFSNLTTGSDLPFISLVTLGTSIIPSIFYAMITSLAHIKRLCRKYISDFVSLQEGLNVKKMPFPSTSIPPNQSIIAAISLVSAIYIAHCILKKKSESEDQFLSDADSAGTLPPMPLLPISSSKTISMCRNLELRDSDIFICSYPKSGTTWMQQ